MTQKNTLKIAAVLVLCIVITTAIFDTYILKNDSLGLTYGISAVLLVIGIPAALIITGLYGTGKIAASLASPKVDSNEKKGIIKRLFIVIIIAAAALALFGIVSAIGTKFIDI